MLLQPQRRVIAALLQLHLHIPHLLYGAFTLQASLLFHIVRLLYQLVRG